MNKSYFKSLILAGLVVLLMQGSTALATADVPVLKADAAAPVFWTELYGAFLNPYFSINYEGSLADNEYVELQISTDDGSTWAVQTDLSGQDVVTRENPIPVTLMRTGNSCHLFRARLVEADQTPITEFSDAISVCLKNPNQLRYASPKIIAASITRSRTTIRWTAHEAATEYLVRLFRKRDGKVVRTVHVTPTDRTAVSIKKRLTKLTTATDYFVSVQALYETSEKSKPSKKVGFTTQ